MAEKLKSAAKTNSTSADVIEEFEDEQGNVFNKKTYEGIVFIDNILIYRSQTTRNYLKRNINPLQNQSDFFSGILFEF